MIVGKRQHRDTMIAAERGKPRAFASRADDADAAKPTHIEAWIVIAQIGPQIGRLASRGQAIERAASFIQSAESVGCHDFLRITEP
jgi:cytochrome c-type biogenesis protein CcmH/NrfG